MFNCHESYRNKLLLSNCITLIVIGYFSLPIFFMILIVIFIIKYIRVSALLLITLGFFGLYYNWNSVSNTILCINQLDSLRLSLSKNVIEFNNYLKVVIFLGLILGGFLNLFYEYIVKLKIKNNNLKNTIKNNKFKKHNGNLVGFDNLNNNPVYLLDKDANSHTLLIGTTGSGKTTAICSIVENVIKRRKALFYVDGKGDMTLARRVETYAKKSSVPFYLFSLNSQSIKYNPIASGGYTSKKDRIIELRNWTEEHYKKIAEGYLQTIFQVLEELGLQVDLYLLSKYLDLDELSILARKAKSRYLFNIISKLEKNSKDVSSLIFEIENLVNSEIGHVFDCSSGNVLTLESAMKENAIVYFCLNTLAFPSYSNIIGKLIINDLKNLFSMQLDVEKKNYVYTIFDEFSVFAGSQVINLINQGREVGVCALLATQSVSDITAVGGKSLLGQILNSCNNYIIQRQNNPDDAEILANIIGTQDAYTITTQLKQDGLSTIKPMREFLFHPDEIKRLKTGEAIFVNKNRFNINKIRINRGSI